MGVCELCTELRSPISAKAWNQPLFESPNFVALPSLGSLIEGWVLLVPKHHFISLGEVSGAMLSEMNKFKEFLCSVLNECYGTVSVFEHGPSAARRTVGCGVDHAHLHLVPLRFDLCTGVSSFLPSGVTWTNAGIEKCQEAYSQGLDYLYLEQPIGFGRIATHNEFGSQLFRQAIAAQIGIQDEYNWRKYRQMPTVMATIQRLKTWAASKSHDDRPVLVA
jgi:ATP adenylyltransferase